MKKFYKYVSVEALDDGFSVALDGRLVKTPGRAALVLPTRALADAVAGEWAAQEEDIKPDTMPLTQYASTAIDRVAGRHDDVVREVTGFGATDLLCYRATEPAELVTEQAAVWNPYLVWAAETLEAPLKVTTGIIPIAQDDDVLARLMAYVAGYDAFELTALHAFTNGLGSLVLALAHMSGYSPLEAVWQASILDAVHQEKEWGTDWETEEKRDRVYAEMVAAAEFISHLRNKNVETV